MEPASDRVRRVLSDTASPAATPAAPRTRALRERLAALGLGSAPARPGGDDASAWAGADDGRPLEVQVGGEVRTTPHGAFLYAERRVGLERTHGVQRLADALGRPVPLRKRERRRGGPPQLEAGDAIFLDTETTGLAGGTGTVAFLVGTGQVEGDTFVVRQYCMRDYPEERALLHALMADVADRPLVTFNGRSFDWPLLTTRLQLHRMRPARPTHLDLLPAARRLWVDSVPSHTLGALEEHVLGLRREDDLPGWRIPQAYFDYLRTGRGGLVALAFRHNETDVVSMLALLGRVGAILQDPTRRAGATARDLLGTSRFFLELGDARRAERALEEGLVRANREEAPPLRRLLGHLCRRDGRYEEALAHWTALARTAPAFDVEAFEQVAKLHEHRRRDFPVALEWVEEALLHVAPGSRAEAALRHRQERLRRRAARAPAGETATARERRP